MSYRHPQLIYNRDQQDGDLPPPSDQPRQPRAEDPYRRPPTFAAPASFAPTFAQEARPPQFEARPLPLPVPQPRLTSSSSASPYGHLLSKPPQRSSGALERGTLLDRMLPAQEIPKPRPSPDVGGLYYTAPTGFNYKVSEPPRVSETAEATPMVYRAPTVAQYSTAAYRPVTPRTIDLTGDDEQPVQKRSRPEVQVPNRRPDESSSTTGNFLYSRPTVAPPLQFVYSQQQQYQPQQQRQTSPQRQQPTYQTQQRQQQQPQQRQQQQPQQPQQRQQQSQGYQQQQRQQPRSREQSPARSRLPVVTASTTQRAGAYNQHRSNSHPAPTLASQVVPATLARVVIDTCVFLNFSEHDLGLLGHKRTIQICIPLSVLNELDGHNKSHSADRSHSARRARDWIIAQQAHVRIEKRAECEFLSRQTNDDKILGFGCLLLGEEKARVEHEQDLQRQMANDEMAKYGKVLRHPKPVEPIKIYMCTNDNMLSLKASNEGMLTCDHHGIFRL